MKIYKVKTFDVGNDFEISTLYTEYEDAVQQALECREKYSDAVIEVWEESSLSCDSQLSIASVEIF